MYIQFADLSYPVSGIGWFNLAGYHTYLLFLLLWYIPYQY